MNYNEAMTKEIKKILTVAEITNQDGCFDLQFRKDVRHERSGSPTYYRWKIQFVITCPKEQIKILQKVKRELACGEIYTTKNQSRFCVQTIDNIIEDIVPYFTKNKLSGNKKRDFELWKKAVEIIAENKGKKILAWKKSDLNALIQIHKSIAQYKNKPRQSKWADMAKTFANN